MISAIRGWLILSAVFSSISILEKVFPIIASHLIDNAISPQTVGVAPFRRALLAFNFRGRFDSLPRVFIGEIARVLDA